MRQILAVVSRLLSRRALKYGYVNELSQDPESGQEIETCYSPYYEFEQRSDDRVVLARVVITLGGERAPKDYKFASPFYENAVDAQRDGIVVWVWEAYFINTSSDVIAVTPKSVMGASLSDVPLEILPGQWKITPPLVDLNSNYGVQSPVSFEYEYAGKLYQVDGVAKRMTVEQVRQKYTGALTDGGLLFSDQPSRRASCVQAESPVLRGAPVRT